MFAKGKWHCLTETTGMVSPKYADEVREFNLAKIQTYLDDGYNVKSVSTGMMAAVGNQHRDVTHYKGPTYVYTFVLEK